LLCCPRSAPHARGAYLHVTDASDAEVAVRLHDDDPRALLAATCGLLAPDYLEAVGLDL
jgi:hypothetical protein